MNNLMNETLLTLREAAKQMPSRPDISSCWRWCTRGVRGVVLETIVIAGRRFTSAEAISRFVAKTTAVSSRNGAVVSETSNSRAEQRKIEAALDEAFGKRNVK